MGLITCGPGGSTTAEVFTAINEAVLKSWESAAAQMTSASYAIEPYGVEVKVYTSNGDGTFTATPQVGVYSALHHDTDAATSASNAATSESNAATSASNAATSESNAATSASNAAISESNAATSASNAATSETNAATSESNAATSASNAAISETNAALSYDNFDDRYLGAKASDPTLDNDGDPLLTGALYWNTSANEMRAYDGVSWNAITAAGAVGGGADKIFWENDQTVTADYTITSSKNAMTAGDITINTGVTVTVPTGVRWVIV